MTTAKRNLRPAAFIGISSALAIALGMRLSLYEAAKIANIAAGVAVSHHGTWAVKADELLAYAETAKVAQQ